MTKEERREWRRKKLEQDPEWAQKEKAKAIARSRKWYQENKDRAKENSERWRSEHPEKVREIARESMHRRYLKGRKSELLRQRYGLTLERYEELVNGCNGKCPICKRPFGPRGPYVDHDHEHNHVRGIICQKCNFAEGYLGSPQAAFSLYQYMEKNAIFYPNGSLT